MRDPKSDWMARWEAIRDVAPWYARLVDLALYVPFLYEQRVKGFAIGGAHFDDASTGHFVGRLAAARSYLEFGSGGSTLLAAQRGIPFTSVDSDPWFLKAVERALPPEGRDRRRLLHVDIGVTQAWGVPVLRNKTPRRREMWRRYCEAPWLDWPTEVPFPDVVLVDGRFRVACALSTIRALSQRGRKDWELLVDDYEARRPFYAEIEQFARLAKMVGRMAVFVPRDSVDLERLNERLEVYALDWR
jgi:hypothetical protein